MAGLLLVLVGVGSLASVLVAYYAQRFSGLDPDIDSKTGYCFRGRCWWGRRISSAAELDAVLAATKMKTGARDSLRNCWNAALWYDRFAKEEVWSRSSQRWADSVLASLFAETNLGTTNKFVVEFGFDAVGWKDSSGGGSNSKMLRLDLGWKGIAFDIENEMLADNIFKEFVTPDNVVGVFDKHGVPKDSDYVSIDIDSCDLGVFLNLTARHYRPRVLTVEYNSAYELDQSKTIRCELPTGEKFSWPSLGYGQLYGSSLRALHKAAEMRGYSMVYALPLNDVFLVRSDLICKDSMVRITNFRNSTGIVGFQPPNHIKDYAKWVIDF